MNKIKEINNKKEHIFRKQKESNLVLTNNIYNKKPSSYEKKQKIINNKLSKENIKPSYLIFKSNTISGKSLNKKIIKRNNPDSTFNPIIKKSYKKKLLFLDSVQSNKTIDKSKHNRNHLVSNTDTNLNTLIKVNIKNNKEKDLTSINRTIRKRKVLKDNIDINNISYKCLNFKEYLEDYQKINKIIIIQNWWKKYFYKQNIFEKIHNFINIIKKIICANIMKQFIKCSCSLKYYFLKWYHIVNYKKILDKLIIYEQKFYINKTINMTKSSNAIHIKKKNIENKKIQKKNVLNNFKKLRKINQNKLTFNTDMSCIIDSLLNTINNDNDIHHFTLEKKSPIIASISSKNNTYSQRILRKNNFEKQNYSTLNNNKKNKLLFKTADSNNSNSIKNIIKTQINKINNNNNERQTNKINNLNKNNKNNNYIGNKNLIKYNEKNMIINHNKENNLLFKIKSNYILKNNKTRNTNKALKKKLNIFINETGNITHSNIQKPKLSLNTEPNFIYNNNYNNSISNTNNSIKNKNNILNTINVSYNNSINNNKKKVIKDRLFKIKKFDTCPLTLKNKKFNIYIKFYIKKYLYFWKEISLKNKILSYFIKQSKIIYLRKIFYKRIINDLIKLFKMILLKQYFNKYKDIIIRIIILRKLKYYNIQNLNNNKNLKRGDIINNININNFINYTNNDISNYIPKSTKNYNILPNSVKLNNNIPTYFKSPFSYFNNFNNINELNIINTNINLDLNKNYNMNKPKGILVNQINQISMVFNLLEQHYRKSRPSLFKCFTKWKNNSKLYNNYNKYNYRKIEKREINEKIINFKKINIQNNNNIINNNKDYQINNEVNTIKKYEIKNINISTLRPKKELNNRNKITRINNNKHIYSARYSNNIRDSEFENINNSLHNNNKGIKYIDINKNLYDNSYESSILRNNFNSEIVYQRKILNFNHITNLNNSNYQNSNIISSDNKFPFKKLKKIEEREVHFDSLSKNKNITYNSIENNFNYYNNDNYTVFNNNKNEIDSNYLENKMKKQISKIRIDIPININDNNLEDENDKINNNKILFNRIKNSFSKDIKLENKKVNQTFCGLRVFLEDGFD